MRHLKRDRLLEWAETGGADESSRAHLETCPECTAELASIRDVLQVLARSDTAPDLDEPKALQFRHDLSRKIRFVPEPGPFWGRWNPLRHLVPFHYAVIGAVITAVLVFSIVSVFQYRYGKIIHTGPIQVARDAPETANPESDLSVPVEATEDALASQNLQASDLFEAAVDSEGSSDDEMGVASEFSSDPFQHIPDLRPEEVTQLKALIKEQLKS
ncbi:MAG: hypothetical protein LAO21_07235 [Acidobacteriia bacterium]|nr:hypothetical protein [Terriglobia bacterium]